ncbi:glycerol-3-phosphate acyltransferase PlsY [Orenia metallireducens]|jgi:glycerol-3-phosphate acyltransferase PlsY|uniref:Glycerol-3-phosphate acyltransferase n=1 Tax=Orenia metallireducens TaxID=1413210 RepID=A0A285HUW3_9FIRM|nr:glycerol-3-phosphate 1-O-acyltransferase PlsY [Orenia metallireducens]PRX31003.1 glycerol-3-phosphate acyltransferase PlsY [Orenia metallireducens]SNY39494.1 glycerol-3-phosphate acyltransferase PlsY [Orenia metallireducens]
MIKEVLVMLFAYLLGSIPFALLVVKLVKGVDIREYGSGNVGATNAFRILGLGLGISVALLDIGKGFIAVAVARHFFADQPLLLLIAGLLSIAGHNWPIFLKFKGGKGVATSVGVLISLSPKTILFAFFIWMIVILTTQYVSLASIIAAIVIPILMYLFGQETIFIILAVLIAIFVIYRHQSNIKRLLAGTENKVSLNKRAND